jgi:hypothetical protein
MKMPYWLRKSFEDTCPSVLLQVLVECCAVEQGSGRTGVMLDDAVELSLLLLARAKPCSSSQSSAHALPFTLIDQTQSLLEVALEGRAASPHLRKLHQELLARRGSYLAQLRDHASQQ